MQPTIRVGSTGQAVTAWQRAIGVSVDGVFGPRTELATKQWQQRHGLIADGIVGPKTWATVREEAPTLKPLVRGIDVSAMQGDITDADWAAIKKLGIEFAYMRLAVGNETWIDARARKNAERAKTHGVTPGFYLFPYPLPHLDPKKQIDRFVRLLDGLGMNPGELPPMFDLEWPPPEEWAKWKCSPGQLQDWGLTALERADELTGVRWPVYLYRWWAKMANLASAPQYGRYPLVIADYTYMGVVPTPEQIDATKIIAPWTKDALLSVQHDGNGGLRLPNGVDADFQVMPGGHEALVQWSRGSTKPVSAPVSDRSRTLYPGAIITSDNDVAIIDSEIAAYRRNRVDIAA